MSEVVELQGVDEAGEVATCACAMGSLDDFASVPVDRRVLVIGGGITGITAAIDLGNAGYKVVMVERLPSVGGRMLQLSETFPTLDCAQCTLTPRTVESGQHPNVTLKTSCEVEKLSGAPGDFEVLVRQKRTFVDWNKCTGCGTCIEKCPSLGVAAFERDAGKMKAIYTLSPQAVPNKPQIDPDRCRYLTRGKCGVCAKVCPVGAIDYEQRESFFTVKVGAIVVATGFDIYDWKKLMPEYGGGKIPDVIDGLTIERFLSASGPTAGAMKRPSDGRTPKEVVFIQCVGSRNPEFHKSYCSRVCCTHSIENALELKRRNADMSVYILYRDIRTYGEREYLYKAAREAGVIFIRYRLENKPQVTVDGDKIRVSVIDHVLGRPVVIETDLLSLASAVVPTADDKLAQLFKVPLNDDGFFVEKHAKLGPSEFATDGVFLCGLAHYPKPIDESVAQGRAAASRAVTLLSRGKIYTSGTIAQTDPFFCSSCGVCVAVCPYSAPSFTAEGPFAGKAEINPVLCKGCGLCVASCRSGAIHLKGFDNDQIFAQLFALSEEAV